MPATERPPGRSRPGSGQHDPAACLVDRLGRATNPLGVTLRDLPRKDRPPGPASLAGAAREVHALGGEVLVLPSLRAASARLDRGELREAGSEATRAGIRLEATLCAVHPRRLDFAEVDSLLEAGAELGVSAYHISFGVLADRFTTSPPWAQQLSEGVAGLRSIVDSSGVPVVLRTHEEMTTFELLRLWEAVGRTRLRVGFSPVNVVTRMEDPMAACERVADLVHTLFLDDCQVIRTPSGSARRLTRLGTGSIPWLEILDRVRPSTGVGPAVIADAHRAQFDMPYLDAEWLSHHPDLTVAELVAVVQAQSKANVVQVDPAHRATAGREIISLASAFRGEKLRRVASPS